MALGKNQQLVIDVLTEKSKKAINAVEVASLLHTGSPHYNGWYRPGRHHFGRAIKLIDDLQAKGLIEVDGTVGTIWTKKYKLVGIDAR
jgi:hypothetical protein